MKALDQAIAVTQAAAPDDPVRKAQRLIEVARTRTERVEAALDEALKCLCGIRFCEWPHVGLGIGLSPEELDRIINEGDAALGMARRKVPNSNR